MLDIAIAVLLISFGSALAYMGIHVTLSPPASKTHLRWRVGFVVIAVLIGSLAEVQAYRSNKAAGRIEALIQKGEQGDPAGRTRRRWPPRQCSGSASASAGAT